MSRWTEFNSQMSKLVDWRRVATEVLGLELTGEPATNGWCPCQSVDGSDDSPSAGYNVINGYYKDFRDGEDACSSYDLMVQLNLAGTFMEAKKHIAGVFGVKWVGGSKDVNDPEYGIEWQPWHDNMTISFCKAKPPITCAGLKKAGARMCVRLGVPCFAFPAWGKDNQTVGWMFLPRNGLPFEHQAARGAKSICKIQEGEEYSFITGDATNQALNEFNKEILWCEGAPDMIAGFSVFPDQHFVTNAHGCAEKLNDEQRARIHTHEHRLTIIGDADIPGARGAWAKMLAWGPSLATVAAKIPPYSIEEKHGRDYRDYLTEFGASMKLPEDGLIIPQYIVQEANEDAAAKIEGDSTEEFSRRSEKSLKSAEAILHKVGLAITGSSVGGAMSLYSNKLNRSKSVPNIALLKYINWVQFLGCSFSSYVTETQRDWETEMANGNKVISFRDFNKAVAIAATRRELCEFEQLGAGLWPVIDVDGDPTGEIAVVKSGRAYKYNSDLSFIQLSTPVVGKNCCDIGTTFDWFNPDTLAGYIEEAQDPKWRNEVYGELYRLFVQWRWENESMSQLAIGLIFATAMQALHAWRPIVALTGESNSGKTILMAVITRLFGGLAQFSARSTAAGVFQNMGNDSRPLLLDEFDSGNEQRKLLKIFRAASRGQETLMGTAYHSGKIYKSQHIPWISGIHASSNDQADLNRMIPLRILPALKNAKTLIVPDARRLKDLGLKMIAGVIVTAQAALEIAQQLNQTDGDTIQSRYRESYAIPFGNLGAFLGLDTAGTWDVMNDYLRTHVSPEVHMEDAPTDQESLLLDIMQCEVKMGRDAPEEVASVAEILFDPRFKMHRDCARTKGVGYVISKFNPERIKVCFVGRALIKKSGLLGQTDWSAVPGILQVLARLPKDLIPVKEKQMVAGMISTCLSVDYDALKKWVSVKELRPARRQLPPAVEYPEAVDGPDGRLQQPQEGTESPGATSESS